MLHYRLPFTMMKLSRQQGALQYRGRFHNVDVLTACIRTGSTHHPEYPVASGHYCRKQRIH